MKIWMILLCGLMLGGCERPLWQDVGGDYADASQGFAVTLPVGWKKLNAVKDILVISRDGLSLQMIVITRDPIDKPLLYTKKKLNKDMLPQEAAEVVKDELFSNSKLGNVELIEEDPATIGGYSGFKLVDQYHPQDGPMMKAVKYGLIQKDWYYELTYSAPARHYFDKDVATFEKIKNSFRITAQ